MAAFTQGVAASRTGSFPPGLPFIAYAAYRAVGAADELPREQRASLAAQALRVLASAPGVALRGTYDTSGYRSDCHLLIWLAAPGPDLLQDALSAFCRTRMAAALEPFWTAIGVHRPTEYTKLNVPAYFRGEVARRYVCVHPLAHAADWYQLDPHQRKRMLADDNRFARNDPDVRSNTVGAFGMGDHEWLQSFESDQLVRIVDLQRELRSSALRRYTQGEKPMITGARKPLGEILAALP